MRGSNSWAQHFYNWFVIQPTATNPEKQKDYKKPEKKGTGTGYPTAQELLAKREAGNGKIPQVG